jgi:catechol 2,3-dioxygenase-like lactoylglutathione lyase family enzyme
MISGAHVILYSANAEADRAFIRDALAFPWVDAGAGWLIFKLPPAEVAVHPTEGPAKHEFYLMCDDLEETLIELAAKGVRISRPPSDERWGVLASIHLPSGAKLFLYKPQHPTAYDLNLQQSTKGEQHQG